MKIIFFCIVVMICFQGFADSREAGIKPVKILKKICLDYNKLETLSGRMDIYLGSPVPGVDRIIGER